MFNVDYSCLSKSITFQHNSWSQWHTVQVSKDHTMKQKWLSMNGCKSKRLISTTGFF